MKHPTVYRARQGFTLFLLMQNVKQESCEYQLLVFVLTQPGIEPESTVSVQTLYPLGHWSA